MTVTSTKTPPLGWSSPSADTFTRPLDNLETFYKLLADAGAPLNLEQWIITTRLKLSFPRSVADPTLCLRRTWLLLRKLHPHLGAVASPAPAFGTDDPPSVLTIEPFRPDEWLEETFFIHDKYRDADEALLELRPAQTARAHWLPKTSELLIQASHWRIDGIGKLMLVHSFLTSLASVIRQGLDVPLESYASNIGRGSLPPSLADLTGTPATEDATPDYLKKCADGLAATFLKGMPSIGLPTIKGSEAALPGVTHRASLVLDAATSQALKAACDARGFSIAAATHAAIIRAAQTYPQSSACTSYATFFATDLRKLLPSPYNSAEYAGGLYCSGLPLSVNDVFDKPFDEVVAEVSLAYKTDLNDLTRDDEGNPVSVLKVTGPFLRRTTRIFNTPPPPEMPPMETPDLSSLGKLEKFLEREYTFGDGEDDKIELQDFWLTVGILGRSSYFHVLTFRDQTRLQVCYNSSYYTKELMDEVLEKVTGELIKGLGI